MNAPENAARAAESLRARIARASLYLWIAGTAIFFYLRFSLEFYYANQGAIRAMLDRVGK